MKAQNRYYHPTRFTSRTQLLASNVKCVFISYQKRDEQQAEKIADYLQEAGIEIYFDRYDSELRIQHQNDNPKKVTEAICKGINNSSHMIVLISPTTILSSWVPFEIGYGFEKTDLSVLCLKGIPKGALPEYVRTAKIIRDIHDFNKTIASVKGTSEELLLKSKLLSAYNYSYNPLNDVMDSIVSDVY